VTPAGSPFSLDGQFLYLKAWCLELINLGQKPPIDRRGFRRAIYVVDIGQNHIDPSYQILTIPK
jgi:hypothetical protein